jgi:hypothetical protein
MSFSSSSSELVPGITIKETLEVLLLCFEAAADTAPHLLAYAMEVDDPSNPPKDIPSYVVWRTDDLHDPPSPQELSTISFPPESLIAAFARMNLCDTFALLLEKETNWLLKDFRGRAEWIVLDPQPALALYPSRQRRQLARRSHSVLMVTLKDGSKMVMDGTLEQFKWSRSTWFLKIRDFNRRRMGSWSRPAPEWYKARIQGSFKAKDAGFWAKIQEKMEDLFDELDWDQLKSLPEQERVRVVKRQAEAKFAGVWEQTGGMLAAWHQVR